MRLFICILLFTFIIFLDSVQSSNQPPLRNEQSQLPTSLAGESRPHPLRPNDQQLPLSTPTPYRGQSGDGTVHYMGGRTYGLRIDDAIFPIGVVTEDDVARMRHLPPRQVSSQQPVHLIDGDFIFRARIPIGRVKTQKIYEINSFARRIQPQDGDLVVRSDIPIAVYENNRFREYHHQQHQ